MPSMIGTMLAGAVVAAVTVGTLEQVGQAVEAMLWVVANALAGAGGGA